MLLVVVVGCSVDPVEPNHVHQGSPGDEGLVVNFQLTDGNGNPTTEFLFGQDIFFDVSAANLTGKDQPWSDSYYNIPFGFWVDAVDPGRRYGMGSTLDGCACRCEPESGVLGQGATLAHNAVWSEYPGHIVLPAGDYVASVSFSLRFDNISPVIEPIVFTVLPSKPNDEHVFSMFRMPAMGFCPPDGRFLWAHVVKSEFVGVDRYILVGERVIEYGLGVPGCPPEWPCPVTAQTTPLILDESQAHNLQQLMAGFPTVDPDINHACDPCYITLYRFEGVMRRVGPCVYGPPEYREHMNDLEQFIESLVPNVSSEQELVTFPAPPYRLR
jgi:hypothetical protein